MLGSGVPYLGLFGNASCDEVRHDLSRERALGRGLLGPSEPNMIYRYDEREREREIYIYIYTYTYMCIYIDICMYVYIYVPIYLCIYLLRRILHIDFCLYMVKLVFKYIHECI